MARFNDDSGNEPYDMGEVKAVGATEKALKVVYGEQTIWIPKSVVHDDSQVWKNGDEGNLVVKKWFADKQGYGG